MVPYIQYITSLYSTESIVWPHHLVCVTSQDIVLLKWHHLLFISEEHKWNTLISYSYRWHTTTIPHSKSQFSPMWPGHLQCNMTGPLYIQTQCMLICVCGMSEYFCLHSIFVLCMYMEITQCTYIQIFLSACCMCVTVLANP